MLFCPKWITKRPEWLAFCFPLLDAQDRWLAIDYMIMILNIIIKIMLTANNAGSMRDRLGEPSV